MARKVQRTARTGHATNPWHSMASQHTSWIQPLCRAGHVLQTCCKQCAPARAPDRFTHTSCKARRPSANARASTGHRSDPPSRNRVIDMRACHLCGDGGGGAVPCSSSSLGCSTGSVSLHCEAAGVTSAELDGAALCADHSFCVRVSIARPAARTLSDTCTNIRLKHTHAHAHTPRSTRACAHTWGHEDARSLTPHTYTRARARARRRSLARSHACTTHRHRPA